MVAPGSNLTKDNQWEKNMTYVLYIWQMQTMIASKRLVMQVAKYK